MKKEPKLKHKRKRESEDVEELKMLLTSLTLDSIDVPEEFKDAKKRAVYYSLPVRANIIYLVQFISKLHIICINELADIPDEDEKKQLKILKKYMAKHEDAYCKLHALLHREITEPIFDIEKMMKGYKEIEKED